MTEQSPKMEFLKRFRAIAIALLWLLPSYGADA